MSGTWATNATATVIDYLTVVLSPALIVGLITSLVFFLLEILYPSEGPWRFRLQWILFFYIAGVVLTGRIALQGEAASRASLYSLVLAALTYFGLSGFIEYPPAVRPWSFLANLFLVGLVWWSAQRLVRDCTHVDDDVEGSAEGLMQAAGWEEGTTPTFEPDTSPKQPPEKQSEKPLSFLERWRQYNEQSRSGRVLGLWVVYFSLAALPLFGLGQALIPIENPERRVWSFQLLAIYLACGLGLLLTTCFLGLRRYLRQRRLQMPARMTATWLTAGGVLIVGLLLAAAVLPRPYSENAVWSNWKAGSQKRQASNWSPKGDSPAEGKGSKGEAKDNKGDPGNKGGKDGDPGKDGKDGKDRDGKGGKGETKDKDGKDGKKSDPGGKKPGDAKSEPSPPPPSTWHPNLAGVAEWVKWIVFAVLIVGVIYLLIRHGLAFFAHFSDWAKAWLAWWRGLVGQRSEGVAEDDLPIEADADTPFAAFRDPFATGSANRWTPRQLLRYSFAALEAWARERGVDRGEAETAQEFVGRLAAEYPALAREAQALLRIYTLAEYSSQEAPAETEAILRAFWQRLSRATSTPLSA